jgi:hypothetical protein
MLKATMYKATNMKSLDLKAVGVPKSKTAKPALRPAIIKLRGSGVDPEQ